MSLATETKKNVIKKYSETHLNADAFDSKSIMLYALPKELFLSGVGTSNNTEISKRDKAFARKIYPRTP